MRLGSCCWSLPPSRSVTRRCGGGPPTVSTSPRPQPSPPMRLTCWKSGSASVSGTHWCDPPCTHPPPCPTGAGLMPRSRSPPRRPTTPTAVPGTAARPHRDPMRTRPPTWKPPPTAPWRVDGSPQRARFLSCQPPCPPSPSYASTAHCVPPKQCVTPVRRSGHSVSCPASTPACSNHSTASVPTGCAPRSPTKPDATMPQCHCCCRQRMACV